MDEMDIALSKLERMEEAELYFDLEPELPYHLKLSMALREVLCPDWKQKEIFSVRW